MLLLPKKFLPKRNNTPYCRLGVMYFLPHLLNTRDHMINVSTTEVD